MVVGIGWIDTWCSDTLPVSDAEIASMMSFEALQSLFVISFSSYALTENHKESYEEYTPSHECRDVFA